MSDVLGTIGEGLEQSFLMAYEVWWALVLGFAISAIVQAWVPARADRGGALGRRRRGPSAGRPASAPPPPPAPTRRSRSPSRSSRRAPRPPPRSPSSSPRRTSSGSSGLVLWVLLGWQFTLAEYVGGIVMIVLMAAAAAALRLAAARGGRRGAHAQAGRHRPPAPRGGRERPAGASGCAPRTPGRTSPTTSAATGRCSGRRSRSASCSPGFIGLLGDDFFNGLFVTDAPALVRDDRERDRRAR